ncbi:MAG TPA: radical SAM protein [Chitinophaga sp.]|uniref:radical SAM protein n=1 Tax=Chitinophaga sp. TaxID=1869181 RepID=UPI002CE88EFF|nr:radical SAM protein [Chitinophaga sp.]HVI47155.1 radical SAM protein [Chitinophaga sp.]
MYTTTDYIARGSRFVRNQLRPSGKVLSTLMIYATDLCNSRCKHCLIWAKRPVVHLPMEKIIEIMQSDCISKSTTIGLEGGEFLLHPQAFEILAWFHEHHPNFDLLSNCLQPEKVIKAVREFPPKRLFLSLDGTRETYKHMRGKDGYDKVLSVISALHEECEISVMFTLSPYNSFDDLAHVMDVCNSYNIDLRVGIYNNISYFDTVDQAHAPGSDGSGNNQNNAATTSAASAGFDIPPEIIERLGDFDENLDFLLLYKYWQRGELKLPCYSIFDSVVVLPNGDVPICQNLDVKLGNVYQKSLDDIFNSSVTIAAQKKFCKDCNGCWINFHRKYDVTLFRQAEQLAGSAVTSRILGKYQWNNQHDSFKKIISAHDSLPGKQV